MRLILTDIDRTILPYGMRSVPRRTREAMRGAISRGCAVGPCTGRALAWASILFDGDDECVSTCIATNGLQVYHAGEKVLEKTIPAECVRRMAALVSELPHAGLVYFDDAQPLLCAGTAEDLTAAFPRYGKICEPAGLPAHDVVKVNAFVAGDDAQTRELARLLSHELPELDFDVPQTGFTNIVPKGWNKGAAALYLRDYLGVAPEDVFVFGDAENDLTMLEAVENSVAVSNATPAAAEPPAGTSARARTSPWQMPSTPSPAASFRSSARLKNETKGQSPCLIKRGAAGMTLAAPRRLLSLCPTSRRPCAAGCSRRWPPRTSRRSRSTCVPAR